MSTIESSTIAPGGTTWAADTVHSNVTFEVETARDYWNISTPHVKELTGREPTSVREFLIANRAALQNAA